MADQNKIDQSKPEQNKIDQNKAEITKLDQNKPDSWMKRIAVFTKETAPEKIAKSPRPMTKEEVKFLLKMVFSEAAELMSTVVEPNEVLAELHDCIGVDFKPNYKKPDTTAEIFAEQMDAMVDWCYYTGNCAAKVGMNLDPIFDVVHQANLDKRFPDGTYHKRLEDGKVIKPDGWKEPNILPIAKLQLEH